MVLVVLVMVMGPAVAVAIAAPVVVAVALLRGGDAAEEHPRGESNSKMFHAPILLKWAGFIAAVTLGYQ